MSRKQETRTKNIKLAKDWDKFKEEFDKESDRAMILLGHSFIDYKLIEYLNGFLINSKTVDALFDPNMPLSTFSYKVEVIYCLGLITDFMRNDLRIVNKIRNIFAHELYGLDFANDKVANKCQELKIYRTYINVLGDDSWNDNRNIYSFTIYQLGIFLDIFIRNVDKNKREKMDEIQFIHNKDLKLNN